MNELKNLSELDIDAALPPEVEAYLADLLEEAEQEYDKGNTAALETILKRVEGREQSHLARAMYGMLRLKGASMVPR